MPQGRAGADFVPPLAAGLLLLVPAVLGLATGTLLLFPSLGPTAVMQAHSPHQRASRPYSVAVGHLCGIVAAYLAVAVAGIGQSPSVFSLGHLTAAHVAASVAAVAITGALQVALRAVHPPAAATTLLIALGAYKLTSHDTVVLIAGIAALAVTGEAVRRRLARGSAA